jgi:hypothetical protein
MGVQVAADWVGAQALELRFTLTWPNGDPLRIPAPLPAAATDGLWQHTCMEMFVATGLDDRYDEYNFSPSGHWAHYRFASERVRCATADHPDNTDPPQALPIHCASQLNGLVLTATVPMAVLPRAQGHTASQQGWLVGLSAVLEHSDGHLSYWALHHPRAQPDFHHPAGRVLRLARPAP